MVNRTISHSKADGDPNKDIAENIKCLLNQLGDLSLDPCLPEEKENKTGYNDGLEVCDEPSCPPRTQAQQQIPILPAVGERGQGPSPRLAGQSASINW